MMAGNMLNKSYYMDTIGLTSDMKLDDTSNADAGFNFYWVDKANHRPVLVDEQGLLIGQQDVPEYTIKSVNLLSNTVKIKCNWEAEQASVFVQVYDNSSEGALLKGFAAAEVGEITKGEYKEVSIDIPSFVGLNSPSVKVLLWADSESLLPYSYPYEI